MGFIALWVAWYHDRRARRAEQRDGTRRQRWLADERRVRDGN